MRIPERQNPTSQYEKRGPGIQLMATSILGWQMVYLNIVDILVSDLFNVGQTKFCGFDRWKGFGSLLRLRQGKAISVNGLNKYRIKIDKGSH
jgi:hypothetical protein